MAEAAASALETAWRRDLIEALVGTVGAWVSILAEGEEPSITASVRRVPSDAPPLPGECFRAPLSTEHGAVSIILQPGSSSGDGGTGTGGSASAVAGGCGASEVRMSDHLKEGLRATAPLLPAMMRELELMVIGQPVVLAQSFGAKGQGCSMVATLGDVETRRTDAEDEDEGDEEGGAPAAPPAPAPAAAAIHARPTSAATSASTAAPTTASRTLAKPSPAARGRTRRTLPADGGAVVRRRSRRSYYTAVYHPPRRWRRYRSQRISALAAVRLLLPRRLQAQVGGQLDTLDLRDALAELKSYKHPPENVRRVVVGVLCLLGRPLASLSTWAHVLPHLRRELQREMLAFDPAASHGGDSTHHSTVWAESRRATEGLTSDEVQKKGSLAVKTMLKWLEVNRLTRHESIAAAVAKLAVE
jgi:hypothetical protein